MANISAQSVMALRKKTGVSMMECKKALVEAEGNEEQAMAILKEKGASKAAKKSDRETAEGTALFSGKAYIQLLCETDFVGRNENFAAFANEILDAVNAGGIEAGKEFFEANKAEKMTQLGENIVLKDLGILEGDIVSGYVHSDKKTTALVALTGGDETLAKDIAMHIAASRPECVSEKQLSNELLEREKAIFIEQAKESGKPDNIIEKMIVGRMKKFVNEVTLYGQAFIKDPETSVGELVKSKNAEVESFVRFEVGEGIEKKEDNFVEEVMAQARD